MTSIGIERILPDIVQLSMDMPGKSANVLTREVWADLARAMDEVHVDPPRGIILYSRKPSIFLAGADLVRISETLDWPEAEIIRFCDEGRAIMRRFSEGPFVSVAAVHGICLGGGMELTLWCDCRIASDDRRTRLGLPEVNLGLVPGWGGTVRLPRLIGLEQAIELITTGEQVSARRALELGIVDEVVSQERLLNAARDCIEREWKSRDFLTRRTRLQSPVQGGVATNAGLRSRAVARIEENRSVNDVAPRVVLDHLLESAGMAEKEACDSESRAMARVYGGRENRGLLHWFFVEERSRKLRSDVSRGATPAIARIGIIGAGQMGSRIAGLALGAGYQVLILDADGEKAEAVASHLVGSVRSGSLRVARTLEEVVEADVVIESIVEKLAVKRQLFARISDAALPSTLLATNTSTIPLSEVADVVAGPERLVGLHFCCPVEPMQLVEVVRGKQTAGATLNGALDLVRTMGKIPVVVGDAAGFVVNRLLCPVFNEALDLLIQGTSAPLIDQAFREFGFAVGPLEMIDFIGVDTIMYSGETFLRTRPELVSLNPVLPALVKRGRLGRKSGEGFYRYPSTEGGPAFDPTLDEVLERYRKRGERQERAVPDVLARLLAPMAAAGESLLAERVVEDSLDVDLCSVLGTTFPQVRGGLLHWSRSR